MDNDGVGDRRHSRRAPVELKVTVQDQGETIQTTTLDVSLRGVFVVDGDPKPLRKVVRLLIDLPDGLTVGVHGVVTRRLEPDEAAKVGIKPGMGVHFYGLNAINRERWERFVRGALGKASKEDTRRITHIDDLSEASLELALTRGIEEAAALERGRQSPKPKLEVVDTAIEPEVRPELIARLARAKSTTPPERKSRPALEVVTERPVDGDQEGSALGLAPEASQGQAVYRLPIGSVEELERFGESALDSGGMIIDTDDVRAPGSMVVVCVVHPESRRELHLSGQVAVVGGGQPGLAVTFSEVTHQLVEEFRQFIVGEAGLQPAEEAEPSSENTIEIELEDLIVDEEDDLPL